MRKAALLTLCVLWAIHAYAQQNSANTSAGHSALRGMNGAQSKPPELWGHWIGQTIPEFFAVEGNPVGQACAYRWIHFNEATPAPTIPDWNLNQKQATQQVLPCSIETAAGKGNQGHNLDHVGVPSVSQDMTVAFGPDKDFIDGDTAPATDDVFAAEAEGFPVASDVTALRWAVFRSGHLSEIHAMVTDFDIAVAEMDLKLLRGPKVTHAKVTYVTLENGYGATWQVGTAVWLVGDVEVELDQWPTFGVRGAKLKMTKEAAPTQPHNMFEK